MKVIKLIFVIAMLSLAGYLTYLIYENLPGEPVNLNMGEITEEPAINFNYGDTPVFEENLRFNHNNISFFIEPTCSEKRRDSMLEAFDWFHSEMQIVSFYEVNRHETADILVGCSDDYIEVGEDLFAAGEGGPSRMINTSKFKTIEEGKISLYRDSVCPKPIVELHELCHVFGFDHTLNPKSIMYNLSRCDQRITPDMIRIIRDLYEIVPLPDAKINSINATKRGRYLDFEITVLNDGMIKITNMSIGLFSKDEKFETFYLGEIGIGYGKTIKATNVKLPSRSTNEIEFKIDSEKEVLEFDEKNNNVRLSV